MPTSSIVPHVAGRELEVPVHLAGVGIVGDRAVGVEVVARPVGRVEHRHRVAGAPDRLVGLRIIGPGDPHGAAAGLPGVVLVLPGLAAGLAGRRHRVMAPQHLAGRGVEPGHPVAHAVVATGGADDDLVLDRERRGGQRDLRRVGEAGFPHDAAVILVGRDDARRVLGGSDDEIAPQRGAAIAVLRLLAGVHAPDDTAGVAGGAVDLVEHACRIGDVDEAVLGERGRLHELIGGDAAQRHGVEELQILDVRLVDLVERRIALAVIGAVVHQPVLRLGLASRAGVTSAASAGPAITVPARSTVRRER